MTADFDPLDTVDIDRMVRVNDERAIRQHETDRLLADGRHVTPMTMDDMRAEKSAAMFAQFAKYKDVFDAPYDYTSPMEPGAA